MMQYIWHDSTSIEGLHPITQVSGVCFDEQGRILLLRQTNEPGKLWNIPGGHPESGESPEQTLAREVYEETTVKIGECALIGYQEVVDDGKSVAYQLRFAARVTQVDPPQIDPAKGTIHKRLFVSPEEVMDYITYPQYREMFASALKWYENNKN